jgi:hypothetical protein
MFRPQKRQDALESPSQTQQIAAIVIPEAANYHIPVIPI